jgi:hypothetical protein
MSFVPTDPRACAAARMDAAWLDAWMPLRQPLMVNPRMIVEARAPISPTAKGAR